MVRTRFAPSPTGNPESIHLGFIIRALWSYAFAKKNNGKFVLRIEDTDRKRSREDTEIELIKILKRFKINWDEGPDIGGEFGPYRQSERLDKYQKAAHKLVELGYAYYDFEAIKLEKEEIKAKYSDSEQLKTLSVRPKARYDDPIMALKRVQNGEEYVVRVKMPEDKEFRHKDFILKKEIKIKGNIIPDLVLLKSDGFPTYHLAVVVDDIDMQISHVFRGQEWISTTPIHLYLYEAFRAEIPKIGHFTVIMDPKTGKKFSKRDLSGTFGVNNWLKMGYPEEAILNYLMLLGWAPKNNQEIYSIDQFIEQFDESGFQKSNPIFNQKKIDWFSGNYIRSFSLEELIHRFFIWENEYYSDLTITKYKDLNETNKLKITKTITLLRERIICYSTLRTELLKVIEIASYIEIDKVKGISEISKDKIIQSLEFFLVNLEYSSQEIWENKIRSLAKNQEIKDSDMFMILRYAIWGDQFSPPLLDICQILGDSECKIRIQKAIAYLKKL
jgi:glutamyl-tRNA synthetase